LSRDIDKYNQIWLGHYRRNSAERVFHNWTVDTFDSPYSTGPGFMSIMKLMAMVL
jgi:hypothetical protein